MATAQLIRIEISDTGISESLNKLVARSHDLVPLNRAIANKLVEFVNANFEEEGRPVKWAPLAKATLDKKSAMGITTGKILQQDGLLRQRLTPDYAFDYASAGTRTPYAALQNFGGKAGRGKKVIVPAREFMVLAPEDVDELIEMVDKYLIE